MRPNSSFFSKIKNFEVQKFLNKLKENIWVFTTILITLISFLVLEISFQYITAFYLAFYWNWSLSLVEFRRRAKQRKYAFSFVKLTLIINKLVEALFKKNFKGRKKVTRTLSPLLFFIFIFIATGENYIYFSLLGSITFEVTRRINEKITNF